MAEIYTNRLLGLVGGAGAVDSLTSAVGSGSAVFATTTITGDVWWKIAGTFASATVSLQLKDPNGVYTEIAASPTTSAEEATFAFPQYSKGIYRVNVSQSSATATLSLWLKGAYKG